ncbi:dUTP diphosphatase [endosymbiont GvMRE of Glomus versiforme]|uniref:dUTP diphosphatase n=1 Tax=endosymbiont GvMRE of Glomus versiforme TaxID=2039283 RepID=UPI000EBB811F|nr:dUTP diphosphatase [endosymbiont GvMRE of Glomus versiforme]RHZ35627.1 DUTP diphosphatase [endosymbiont GvMRE of Glomus versiforme]
MISPKTWKELKEKQVQFDRLIVQKSPTELKWVSYFNAKRLKLALLVEVGEFANEIKSFKAWQKKQEIDWQKAKEELIDCLGYFLGLVGIYQVDMFPSLSVKYERKDLPFNKLLLDFFIETNNLYIKENEEFYNLENIEIKDKDKKNTYYEWLKTFNRICEKLQIDEPALLNIYSEKNKINLERVNAK